MFKISEQDVNFVIGAMENWVVELATIRQTWAEVKIEVIQRSIFPGDFLLPWLFIITMMPLNYILRKCEGGKRFIKLQEKINYHMYMVDNKIFVKNKKELETLIQTIWIFNKDIGMEIAVEKCKMLIIKKGKKEIMNETAQSGKLHNTSLDLVNFFFRLYITLENGDISSNSQKICPNLVFNFCLRLIKQSKYEE